MVQQTSTNPNDSSLQVLACTKTLLDLALDPGWNQDYDDLERRVQGVSALKKLINLGQLSLFVRPGQLERIHEVLSACGAPARAYSAVGQLLELGTTNLRVDYDRVLEQANSIAWSQDLLDFDDAFLLVLANLLRADCIVVRESEEFRAAVDVLENDLPAFNIPIETVDSLPDKIANIEKKAAREDSIIVWTPQFRVIALPSNSTPIDFAYAIHSAVGNSCIKSIVNGNEVPLNTYLQRGDMVEIIRGKETEPDITWLEFVETPLAKRSITRAIRQIRLKKGWRWIKNILGNSVKDYRPALDAFAHNRHYSSVEELAVKVGSGQVTPQELRDWVKQHHEKNSDLVPVDSISEEDESFQCWELTGCCNPLPGDLIVGIRRSELKPVRVHRENCPKLSKTPSENIVPLDWHFQTCIVNFFIIFDDQADVLRPILNRIADRGHEPNLRKLRLLKNGLGQAWIDIHNVSSRADWVQIAKEIKLMYQVQQVAIKKVTPFL